MFARLTGRFEALNADHGIMDVGGVGYAVQCSRKTIAELGPAPVEVTLLIETNVREDAIQLVGFRTSQEQAWFRLLTSVQGVGAKAGLAILSVLSVDDLALAVASGDKGMVARADGVGPKLATRIVTELKDKAPSVPMPEGGVAVAAAAQQNTPIQSTGVNEEAVSALINLGYARGEAFQTVAGLIAQNPDVANDLSTLIRDALRELAA